MEGNYLGACSQSGTCGVYADSREVYETEYECNGTPPPTIGCCYGESVTPTPTPTPTPGGGGGGGGPTPTPTPTGTFIGNIYDDPNASPGGLGGTDNLCVGDTSSLASTGGTINVSRTGENKAKVFSGATYNITTNTQNSDYTITLDLPFPPADPDNPWQCACNADPTDPYRCIYTNRTPGSGVNFFVQRGNIASAWFQTLGGSAWALNNIESNIPESTCTSPSCKPALIGSDAAGNLDSAGFPLTKLGEIVTSDSGGNYIHESDSRTNAVQAKGSGVEVPTENYNYFYNKLAGSAVTLANANKPTAEEGLVTYLYNGDLTINETHGWSVANDEQIVVLVNGDLIIDDTVPGNTRVITVATGGTGFLMFVVNNDLTINSSVGYNTITTDATQANVANIEGVYVADGVLAVAGQAGTTDRKLIGAGTFVGWSGVDLQRNFDNGSSPTLNNNTATEVFVYRPDLLLNAPQEIKSPQMTWREISPRF